MSEIAAWGIREWANLWTAVVLTAALGFQVAGMVSARHRGLR